jgi:hypothetical protein
MPAIVAAIFASAITAAATGIALNARVYSGKGGSKTGIKNYCR